MVPPVAVTPVVTTLLALEETCELTLGLPTPCDCGLIPMALIMPALPVMTMLAVPLGRAGAIEGPLALALPITPATLLPSEVPVSVLGSTGCTIVTVLVLGMAGASPTLPFMPLLTAPAPTNVSEGTLLTVTVPPGVTIDTVVPAETVLPGLNITFSVGLELTIFVVDVAGADELTLP